MFPPCFGDFVLFVRGVFLKGMFNTGVFKTVVFLLGLLTKSTYTSVPPNNFIQTLWAADGQFLS